MCKSTLTAGLNSGNTQLVILFLANLSNVHEIVNYIYHISSELVGRSLAFYLGGIKFDAYQSSIINNISLTSSLHVGGLEILFECQSVIVLLIQLPIRERIRKNRSKNK